MRIILATIALILFISPSWSADFYKGLLAYNNGDYATALEEWTPLAEQGDAAVQYNLGLIYFNGMGVTQDYKEAVKWYTLAAEQGSAAAQFNLALMYDKGLGVIQNYKTAVKWFKLSAQQGHPDAQNNLGVMFVFGTGVPQDYVYGHMWINIANANGSDAFEARQFVEEKMTPAQLEQAQALARECVKKEYKDC